jgi:hypothetical protein
LPPPHLPIAGTVQDQIVCISAKLPSAMALKSHT